MRNCEKNPKLRSNNFYHRENRVYNLIPSIFNRPTFKNTRETVFPSVHLYSKDFYQTMRDSLRQFDNFINIQYSLSSTRHVEAEDLSRKQARIPMV